MATMVTKILIHCEHYQFGALADQVAQSAEDIQRVEDIGDLGVDHYLQVMGARLLSIGRTRELKHAKTRNNDDELKKVTNALKEKEKAIYAMAEAVKEKDVKLVEMEKQVVELEERVNKSEGIFEQLKEEVKKLEGVVTEKEGSVYEVFSQGFEWAISQVTFIAPEIDLSAMDIMKVIANGALVDDDVLAEGKDESTNVAEKEN